jgi:hypothetical protein
MPVPLTEQLTRLQEFISKKQRILAPHHYLILKAGKDDLYMHLAHFLFAVILFNAKSGPQRNITEAFTTAKFHYYILDLSRNLTSSIDNFDKVK